jgi:hypothetical protein
MSNFKKHLHNYAQKELELLGFNETNFSKNALTLLDDLSDLCKNDTDTIKKLLNFLPRLVDNLPIAAITENDFPEVDLESKSNQAVSRCSRYPYVYRTIDGKYWDDRAISFRYANDTMSKKMYLYQTVYNSKQEIELPYYPLESIVIIEDTKQN